MTENIKEALEYAVELAGQEEKIITDNNGVQYYDSNHHTLRELSPKCYPEALELSNLTSLVDYYKHNLNGIKEQTTLVVVESPTRVVVYTENDERQKRTDLIQVRAELPNYPFGIFMAQEEFLIAMQSYFEAGDTRSVVIEFASALAVENSTDLSDDGVLQITTVKNGPASKAKAKVPNPIALTPYRTFHEVTQPDSLFILRVNKHAELALFEADGGAWRNTAKLRVAEYLKEALKDYPNAKVLA